MATEHVIVNYQQVSAAANNIRTTHAQAYQTAASNLKNALEAATANWTGASKTSFEQLCSNLVYPYISQTIPNEIMGAFADVLDQNAQAFADCDSQIAEQIPTQAG